MNTELYHYQIDAMKKMHNGCILGGKVGAGKSRTALAYIYICELGGSLRINGKGVYSEPETPKDIYIITTAKKRDTYEWEDEADYFCLRNKVNVVVDSWNNLHKYTKVYGAVFIFDEQKTTSGKKWAREFIHISRRNHWIMLSATPGDKYIQFWPVLVANGFYQNKSQFEAEHCVFKPFVKYKDVDHYIHTRRIDFYISKILVPMDYVHDIIKNEIVIDCPYDKVDYKYIFKNRWDIYENVPIEEMGKLCYLLRKVSNDHPTRYLETLKIAKKHGKVIIFYNFTYELHKLREIFSKEGFDIGEWNGEVHSEIPKSDKWVYLCQYTSACEGWNCITANTIIFFSQNYSYKITEQAAGRIDRVNTPFKELYYYYLRSKSPIDISITRSLKLKQDFNEKIFMRGVSCNESK